MKPSVERLDGRWGIRFPDGSFGISIGLNSIKCNDRLLVEGIFDKRHFNTGGAWSDEDDIPLGYWSTVECSFLGSFADHKGVPNKTPEEVRLVYDPEFPAWCASRAADKCQPNPKRLGYFTDNERSWDDDPTPGATMKKYLQIVCHAIRAEDDEGLIFGPRLNRPNWGLKSAIGHIGEYCDALAVNYYGVDEPESTRINTFYSWSGLPTLVTEMYAMSKNGCVDGFKPTNATGAGKKVATQQARADFYQRFIRGCSEQTRIIGCHWFKWADDPDDGGKNCGVVGIASTPYDGLLEQMQISNRKWHALYGAAA